MKVGAAISSWKQLAIPLRQRYAGGCDAFCDEKWTNLASRCRKSLGSCLRFKTSLAIAVGRNMGEVKAQKGGGGIATPKLCVGMPGQAQ